MQPDFTPADERYMQLALELAETAAPQADPNPHVACIIVKDEIVIGSGATQVVGQSHAEVVALHEAGSAAKGATVYVTLEPCAHHGRTPPCAEALVKAQVAKVVIACEDPNPLVAGQGLEILQEAGIETLVGLLADQARELNRGFIKRMQSKVPFVTAKMGVSVDGRSAIATGDSNWISNARSRQDAHAYRSTMSAILSTANTVLADDPRLTARDGDELYARQPLRIILDPQARVPESAKVFQQQGNTLLVVAPEKLETVKRKFSAIVEVEVITSPVMGTHFNLSELMQELGRREINNVLLEAGADFQGECINAGIVDELRVYIAPILLGRSNFGVLQLPEISAMGARKELLLSDVKRIGDDVRLTYHFK